MRRVVLKAKEKKRVLDAFSVWDPSGLDRTALESVSQEHGVAAVDAYTTVLHLDSLFAIGPETPLVWKGGTAIQSLLPGPVQRISVDLDFNSTTPNVEILRESIEQANRMLDRSGRIVTIGPIHFGEFFEADHRPHYKTIEFRRLMPSLFDDKATVPDGTFEGQEDAIKIQGRLSRLQINYATMDSLPSYRKKPRSGSSHNHISTPPKRSPRSAPARTTWWPTRSLPPPASTASAGNGSKTSTT